MTTAPPARSPRRASGRCSPSAAARRAPPSRRHRRRAPPRPTPLVPKESRRRSRSHRGRSRRPARRRRRPRPRPRRHPRPAPARPSAVAGAADTSHPDHVIGDGTPAGCTSKAVVDAVAAGRRHHVPVRTGPGHHHHDGHREGPQRPPGRRAGRGRPRHTQRRRQAPHPVPEHLRRGAGLDDVPLPGPGPPAPHAPAPDPGGRELHRRPHRGRRRRCGPGPRRAAHRDRHHVPRQHLRPDRAGPGRCRAAGAEPVPRHAGAGGRVALHRRLVLQRRCDQQHRRELGDPGHA